jgi:hypothetical protein
VAINQVTDGDLRVSATSYLPDFSLKRVGGGKQIFGFTHELRT